VTKGLQPDQHSGLKPLKQVKGLYPSPQGTGVYALITKRLQPILCVLWAWLRPRASLLQATFAYIGYCRRLMTICFDIVID